MAQVAAQASLAAQPALACSVLAQRITVPPGNVSSCGLDTYGPIIPDPYVEVPGIIDGIYDT
jgi:hypothetical protein